MAAGLQIVGDSGIVQIDELYSNYCLVQKGSATVTGGAGANMFQTFNITVNNGVAPFPAWGGGYFATHTTSSVSNGTWTLTITVYVPNGSTYTIPYYVFDQTKSGSGNNFGLQVWNAAGQITFDSGFNYARIANVTTGLDSIVNSTVVGTSTAETVIGLTGNRIYAATTLNAPFAGQSQTAPSGTPQNPGVNYQFRFSYGMVAGQTSQITHRGTLYTYQSGNSSSGSAPAAGIYNRYTSVMAIDVTNF